MNWILKGTLSAALLAVGATGAMAEHGVSDDKIVLGAVDPLTGPPSLLGKAHSLALKVWQEDVNARGGINGRKIEIVFEDDGYVPARALQGLKKMIDVNDIFGLIGTSGSAQLAAMMPLIDELGIPTLNNMAVNSHHFNPPLNSLFVVGPTYCQEVSTGIGYLVEEKGLKDGKFALAFQDDEYGDDVRCGYLKAVEKYGLNNVLELEFKRGQKDFSAEMLRARAAGVTVLISGGVVAEHAILLKEAAKNRMEIAFLGTHASHLTPVQALAGSAGDGYYAADYVPALTSLEVPGVANFMELASTYLSEGEVKSLNRYSLAGYAGALIFEHAMAECGADLTRECVIANLQSLDGFETGGLLGPVTYGEGVRHAPTAVIVLQSNAADKSFSIVSERMEVE
ncbi:MAG: ABC transporter substrate-binding protein [Rhodobacteraceae bacterium]|nr:ABC transporter substrate-binding protein [Paracoccaceae bacterium]